MEKRLQWFAKLAKNWGTQLEKMEQTCILAADVDRSWGTVALQPRIYITRRSGRILHYLAKAVETSDNSDVQRGYFKSHVPRHFFYSAEWYLALPGFCRGRGPSRSRLQYAALGKKRYSVWRWLTTIQEMCHFEAWSRTMLAKDMDPVSSRTIKEARKKDSAIFHKCKQSFRILRVSRFSMC